MNLLHHALDLLAVCSAFFLLALAFQLVRLIWNRGRVSSDVRSLVSAFKQWSPGKKTLYAISFLIGAGHLCLSEFAGQEQIGAFYEAEDHRGTYYVRLYTERQGGVG